MKTLILTLLLAAPIAWAGNPTTRPIVQAPRTPLYATGRPPIIDPRQPVFVPKFAQVNNPPAGHFAESEYAYRFTYPVPIFYGAGSYGWGCGYTGYFGGGGSWGSTQTFWH